MCRVAMDPRTRNCSSRFENALTGLHRNNEAKAREAALAGKGLTSPRSGRRAVITAQRYASSPAHQAWFQRRETSPPSKAQFRFAVGYGRSSYTCFRSDNIFGSLAMPAIKRAFEHTRTRRSGTKAKPGGTRGRLNRRETCEDRVKIVT